MLERISARRLTEQSVPFGMMANIEQASRERVEQIREDANRLRRKRPPDMDLPERNMESKSEQELRERGAKL